jgi:hypothetical protein
MCSWASKLETQEGADISVQIQRPSANRIPSISGDVSLCSIKAFQKKIV